MLTTTTLTTNSIAVTGLPEGATGFCIETGCLFTGPSSNNDWDLHGRLNLPPGNWRILNFAQSMTEEQWREVVAKPDETGVVDIYKNYVNIEHWLTNATESGHSLLKANDIDPLTNPLILINDEKH